MDPEIRSEFDQMLKRHELAEQRALRNEKLADKRHKQWEKRSADADARFERWVAEITARQDKFDRQLQGTRKLVEAGMKIVNNLAKDTRDLKRAQQNFLDSLRIPHNGHTKPT